MHFFRQCIHLFRRRWCKRIIYLLVVCALLLLYMSMEKNRKNSKRSSSDKKGIENSATKVIKNNMHFNSDKSNFVIGVYNAIDVELCPLCFGNDLCQHFTENSIEILSSKSSLKESSTGFWKNGLLKGNVKVQIGIPSPQQWEDFVSLLCWEKSHKAKCNLKDESAKILLADKTLLKASNMKTLHQRFEKMRSDLPLLVCTSDEFVEQLKKAFDDDDDDGELNHDEQLVFMTSLFINPEFTLMKFCKSAGISIPIPKILGSCGRVMVREANWTPLVNYLNESFEVRAGIALQILQTIDDLQNEDPHWFFLNTEFSLDSMAVSSDGEAILIELDNVAVVDKSLFLPSVPNFIYPEGKLCNEICFQTFTDEILLAKNTSKVCSRIQYYGQLMYALACKQLLSDLKEHKLDGFFNFDGQRTHKSSLHTGFLHSIPEKDKETIEDLLKECVQETSVGGRKQAVEELRDVLEKYLKYVDHDEESPQEHYKKVHHYEDDEN